jgi:hypothetical protein
MTTGKGAQREREVVEVRADVEEGEAHCLLGLVATGGDRLKETYRGLVSPTSRASARTHPHSKVPRFPSHTNN